MSSIFVKTIKFFSGFCFVKLVEENFISLNPSSGESMLPTIQPQNDWLLIWKFKLSSNSRHKNEQIQEITNNENLSPQAKKVMKNLTTLGYQIHNEGEGKSKKTFLRSYSVLDNLEVGDVVVARKPTNSDIRVCKRILAKEGDIILMDPTKKSKLSTIAYHVNVLENEALSADNEDFVGKNDKELIHEKIDELNLNENFLDSYENKFVKVPKGHVWLGGDNTEFSVDSRNYGFLPIGLIEGKVIYHINFNKSFYKFEKITNCYKDI
ncbi:hypothetical protein QEN19_000660 [Hanseniaspora menglaensis]